jgi:hypothetical protein
MSKIFGFLLGIIVAAAGPAAFGSFASGGDLELNAKEFALLFGAWALVLWLAVSLFSGSAALGAALTFGAMVYCVHYIPNRMTNFLQDLPGVRDGMVEGVKTSVLSGLIPVLTVICAIYAIQLMVAAARRRRTRRADEARFEADQEREAALAAAISQADDATARLHASRSQYAARMDGDGDDQTAQYPATQAQAGPDDATAQYQRPDDPTAQYGQADPTEQHRPAGQ